MQMYLTFRKLRKNLNEWKYFNKGNLRIIIYTFFIIQKNLINKWFTKEKFLKRLSTRLQTSV